MGDAAMSLEARLRPEVERLEATFQGRFISRAPTLEQVALQSRSVFGFFVTREWGW